MQHKANASHRVDQFYRLIEVDLPAEPRDVHIDHVIQWSPPGRFLPDFASQSIPQYDLTFMPQQIFEKLKFPSRQLDSSTTTSHFPGHQIHIEIAETKTQGIGRPPAPKQRPNPCHQLCERKRLDQIIIRAAVEAGHPVFQSIARSQQQNRGFHATFAKARQDLKTVTSRQHEVKKNEVEFLGVDTEKRVFAGVRDDDLVALILEALLQRIRDFLFVFNDKDTHGFTISSCEFRRRLASRSPSNSKFAIQYVLLHAEDGSPHAWLFSRVSPGDHDFISGALDSRKSAGSRA